MGTILLISAYFIDFLWHVDIVIACESIKQLSQSVSQSVSRWRKRHLIPSKPLQSRSALWDWAWMCHLSLWLTCEAWLFLASTATWSRFHQLVPRSETAWPTATSTPSLHGSPLVSPPHPPCCHVCYLLSGPSQWMVRHLNGSIGKFMFFLNCF